MKTLRDQTILVIENLNDFELAILRERVMASTEHVIFNEELIRKDLENSGIDPGMYIDTCKNIFNRFNFEELKPKDE